MLFLFIVLYESSANKYMCVKRRKMIVIDAPTLKRNTNNHYTRIFYTLTKGMGPTTFQSYDSFPLDLLYDF